MFEVEVEGKVKLESKWREAPRRVRSTQLGSDRRARQPCRGFAMALVWCRVWFPVKVYLFACTNYW